MEINGAYQFISSFVVVTLRYSYSKIYRKGNRYSFCSSALFIPSLFDIISQEFYIILKYTDMGPNLLVTLDLLLVAC